MKTLKESILNSMKKKEISFIVMYTFKDDGIRDNFLDGIKSKFKLTTESDELDKSSYALPSGKVSDIINGLYDVLKTLDQKKFKEDDFVDLYYAGLMDNNKQKQDLIIRKNVYPEVYNKHCSKQENESLDFGKYLYY